MYLFETPRMYLLIFFLSLITSSLCLTRISLHRSEWTVKGSDKNKNDIDVPATIPGGIYSDLMQSNKLGNIYGYQGDSASAWVGQSDWTYSTTFRISDKILQNQQINLVFDGLDTFSTITLNDKAIGKSENMFVQYIFSVKKFLIIGENTLTVAFRSSVAVAKEFALAQNKTYSVPRACPPNEYHGECNVNQIRKMQSSFSWDYGPSYPSVGIWKNVTLECYNFGNIRYVVAMPQFIPEKQLWSVNVQTYFNWLQDANLTGVLVINLATSANMLTITTPLNKAPNSFGEIVCIVNLEVPDNSVERWWPNEYGKQKLYNLEVIYEKNGNGIEERDDKTIKIGFRTIELVQDAISNGSMFYFKVNGVEMFAKGANKIPIDILPEKGQDKSVIRQVLQSAKDTHMNMIRVWGGGVYESDYFYDLADEFGILIWQDFMFACALYPTRPDYLKSVTEEVSHQAKRLGSHPSIAIWVGNNENEKALFSNWYNTKSNPIYTKDYVKLYTDTIKTEIKRVLSYVFYVTSSPTNGIQSEKQRNFANNIYDSYYGDVHVYNYQSNSWNYRFFPVPRFASEYGFQSMPSLDSWMTVTNDLRDLTPNSNFMNDRQHHPNGNYQNVKLIQQQLDLPDKDDPKNVPTFIYYSQISQAEAIKTETEHYRSFTGRLATNGEGYTMGALFWQLNDVWIGPTWSSIDYLGRWKMLQYFAKNFFNSALVTAKLNDKKQVEIYVVVDRLDVDESEDMEVVFKVYKWDAMGSQLSLNMPFKAEVGKSILVEAISVADALFMLHYGTYEKAISMCFFTFTLRNATDTLSINYLFPKEIKYSNVQKANVKIFAVEEVADVENGFDVKIQTNAIALYVWLDSHEIRGLFSDNGFLLIEDEKIVRFVSEENCSKDELLKALTVVHVKHPQN